MTYSEAIKYLNSFVNYERKTAYPYKKALKLERVEGFLAYLGNPQSGFKSIHVSGTKGKGSVCAFCAYILRAAGYKVGLYTSPHLSDIRERIRVLSPLVGDRGQPRGDEFEGMIGRKELARLVTRLKPQLDKYCRDCPYGPLSFFEVFTVIAFLYFQDKRIDFAVLETGLGGRLDATNVVYPSACGISSISRDHTRLLGNSLSAIAAEKAGIIKPGKPGAGSQRLAVVSAPQPREAFRVIKSRCVKEKAVLYGVGREISYRNIKAGPTFQRFDLSGVDREYRDLRIGLFGEHQVINASLAVGLMGSLIISRQAQIVKKDIKTGLADTLWPGRFEIVPGDPAVVLDGAHNDASAKSLRQTLQGVFGGRDTVFLLGISQDKDIARICRELSRCGKKFILTRANNPRAAAPGQILRKLRSCKPGIPAFISENVRDGLKLALAETAKGGVLVVTGSLFVAAEARNLLVKNRVKYGKV